MYGVVARWLVTRDKDEFTSSDVMPFLKYMKSHKPQWLIEHPIPSKLSEAVRWCKANLVGFKAHSTPGPDPFLLN